MRKHIVIALAALLSACAGEAGGPQAPQESATVAGADMIVELGAMVADGAKGMFDLLYLSRLPDNLKLSAEQQTKIAGAMQATELATRADVQALEAIYRRADQAIKAGKTRAEVTAILAETLPIQLHLRAAAVALHDQIDAILTPAQRDWLAGQDAKRCDPSKIVPLTEAQKAQIKTLTEAFALSTKADAEAIAAAIRRAEEAKRAGKTEAEVKAILDSVKAASERIAAAEQRLRAAIDALLTPEQRASNCPPEIGTPTPPPTRDPGTPTKDPGTPSRDPGNPSKDPGRTAPTPPAPPAPGAPGK